MRWLVAHPGPGFSVHDVFVGWVEGLREIGEQVHIFNLDDRLAFYDSALLEVPGEPGKFRKAVTADEAIGLAVNGLAGSLYKLRPHVLLVVSGFFTDTDILDAARRQGTKVVLLATETPYEDARQLKLAPHCDLVLLNDPISMGRYAAVVPTVYAPHAYRPSVHYPGSSTYPTCDLSFIGTGYPSRQAFFEAMNLDGLDVVLGGNWQGTGPESPLRAFLGHDVQECTDNAVAADLYRATRVGINLYRREADDEAGLVGWSMGPREVEMAACGLFYLRDPRPEGDRLLPMLPTFSSPGEAGEQLRWWLAHPDRRERLAVRACEVVSDRTFAAHAARLLRLFDRQPVSTPTGV